MLLLYNSCRFKDVKCFFFLLFLCYCRAEVHILVNDSNDNAPRFTSPSYEVTVNEGVISTDFLQLEAVDDDCSEANSAICSYEIVTPDVPFAITSEGKQMPDVCSHSATHDSKCKIYGNSCFGDTLCNCKTGLKWSGNA